MIIDLYVQCTCGEILEIDNEGVDSLGEYKIGYRIVVKPCPDCSGKENEDKDKLRAGIDFQLYPGEDAKEVEMFINRK